jgi:hypothetical protein
LLAIGRNSGAPVVELDYCTVDGVGITAFYDGLVQRYAGAIQSSHTRWQNSAVNFATLGSTGAVSDCSFTDDYFSQPGNNGQPAEGSHLQSIHGLIGTFSLTRCLVDWNQSTNAAITAELFWEGYAGPVSGALTDCIISNTGANPMLWPIRCASNPGNPVTVTVTGCAIQKGSNGYALAQSNGATAQIIDGGGNYDYDTGAPINVTSP